MNDTHFSADELIAQLRGKTAASRALFDAASTHDDVSVRKVAAASVYCPADILERLAQDRVIEVVMNVAENPMASASLRQQLSRHQNQNVLVACCFNSVISVEDRRAILERLDASVRSHMARFGCTLPEDVLAFLANDYDYLTRGRLAVRPELPLDLLEQLNRDSVDTVRVSTLNNPRITSDMIQRLANDEDEWVRGCTN